MSTQSNASGGGIGFGGLLAIVFITLKLTGVIDWSWLWVLSPLWIPVAIILGIFLLVAIGAGIKIFIYEPIRDSRRRARLRARNSGK